MEDSVCPITVIQGAFPSSRGTGSRQYPLQHEASSLASTGGDRTLNHDSMNERPQGRSLVSHGHPVQLDAVGERQEGR